MRAAPLLLAGLTVVSLAVPVTAGVAYAAPATPPPAAPVTEAATEAEAVEAARAQGSRVEVTGQRTETSTVFVEPNGVHTAEFSPGPVRVWNGAAWAPVDTTLEVRSDGSIAARSTTAGVTLSAGGRGPLARLSRGGRAMDWSWPGELPEPVLEGSLATYREVLPGVDLRMRATADGFTQHLVIKNRDAAKNPALAGIRMDAKADGLDLRVHDDGAVELVDTAGAAVFAAQRSLMWDSPQVPLPPKDRPQPRAADRADPANHRREAAVAVRKDGSGLVLVPDQALLADPLTSYPVVVDPGWYTPGPARWAVGYERTGQVYVGNANDEETMSDGSWTGRPAKVGHTDDGNWNTRSYFQFDTAPLAGADIISATLKAPTVWSYAGCGGATTTHEMWAMDQSFDALTFDPPKGYLVSNDGIPAVHRGCTYSEAWFNTTTVNTTGPSQYLLKAADKVLGGNGSWRKYDSAGVKLSVNYNRKPDAPAELRTDPPLPAPCRWCDGIPYLATDSVTLQARLTDPDSDSLKPVWRVSGEANDRVGGYLGSNNWFSENVSLVGRDGRQVSWTVRGNDATADGPTANGPGPFGVERAKPVTPAVEGALYRDDNQWHGGVGVLGDFTFSRPYSTGEPGSGNIDHYLYGWQFPPTKKAEAQSLGGPATVRLAPEHDGPQTLYVQAVNRGGKPSDTKEYRVYVRAGNGPRAHYSFEGNAEDDAYLGDRHGTAVGEPTYVPGAVGSAIQLNGTTRTVTAASSVDTDKSFSVSAWARLDQVGADGTVVAEDGVHTSGFRLGVLADGRWAFSLTTSDTATATSTAAISAQPAQEDAWTHLAGVYDSATRRAYLYVNGEQAGTHVRPPAFNATAGLRIGSAKADDEVTGYFPGAIDDVGLYDRVLDTATIRSQVAHADVRAGHWTFDEGAGSTAGNSAGGQALVLSAGNAFTSDGAIGGGVHFDGGGVHAFSSGPVVRTDTALSVAAWVKVDKDGKDAVRAVVGQDGAATSGFTLRYQPADGGRWEFAMPKTDAAAETADRVLSTVEAQVDVWTHVAGVFDAATGQLRLYVDGRPAGTAAHAAGSWNAAGPLQVGCAKWAGQECANPFRGNVDELRVYSRALSVAEVEAIVAQSNVTEGWWKLHGNTMDSSGRGRNGTPSGTPGYTAGGYSANPDPKNLALSLNGRTDFVSAPRTVKTDESFSVAAWVKLDRVGETSTVVSQDGGHVSAFFLQTTPDGRWSFAAMPADLAGQPTPDRVASPGSAQKDQWTHLVGVYDARAGQIELYVNGVSAGSAAHRTAFDAAGGLQIGRGRWNDESAHYFPGAIGDVRVYSRSIFAGEAAQLAGRDLSLVHNWRFDDNAGDAVGGRAGTPVGGTSFGPGRTGNAAVFNGVSGAVSTTGVDLRVDTSFTVSSWVWLNDKGPYGSIRTAVGLDGERNGKFQLGHEYDPDTRTHGHWFFSMPESAANGGVVTTAAVSTLPTEINTWVHLTGVYDASIGKVWLYVNGARVGDGTLNTPWNSSGGLQVGRGAVDGSHQRYWPGKVDDVRVYTGTLDPGRVTALVASYPAQDPPAEVPVPAGRWTFDENTGSVAGDSVGDNDMTLTGTRWHGGRGTTGVWLDGAVGAHARTARPPVHTDQSFSVTGWVYRSGVGAQRRTFLAQDGDRVSSFQLYFDVGGVDRWVVAAPGADNATVATLTSSVATPRDSWAHLGLVYDATAHQLKLYVNGQVVGAKSGVTLNAADGPLSVGRAKRDGLHVDFFNGAVDDVRTFGGVLTDAEVRAVHDDVPPAGVGYWPMDDATGTTAKDVSYRKNDFTLTGGTTWAKGPIGGALKFNGVDGAGVAADGAGNHLDSRTVSAWVRLDGKAKTGTAFAQDGKRMSGFVLQYRAELDRWVFAIPERDDDAAASVSAVSDQPPVVGAWTHLVGVYDHGARQLRLYVDGRLAGVRDGAVGWQAGVLTVGRGKRQGQAADFFAGAVSDVRVALGVTPVDEIQQRSSYPLPLGGQLGRFVNAAGDRYTAGDAGSHTAPFAEVPAGYRFQTPLGLQPTGSVSGTRTLYACLFLGVDEFTSLQEDCEGQVKLGVAGTVYDLTPPSGVPTLPVHRCRAGRDHFESNDAACDGVPGVVNEGLIGHTIAYAPLRRYFDPYTGHHQATVHGGYPGYRAESTRGLVAMTQQPGTQPLFSCLRGRDEFSSLDAACEGAQLVARLGYVWTEAPAGQSSHALYRCLLPYGGHMTTRSDTCEGAGVLPEKQLGYALSSL
ncbi:LamG-like jellyroll fold domain-containing protein [Actinosynnema sp. NPDC023794]